MTEQGFSIVEALRTIELQTSHPTLKKVTQDLRSQVELGKSLSDALSQYPKYFSPVYTSLIKVGEKSATLPKVLSYLEIQKKQFYKIKKKIISAMIYPSVIFSLMIVIGIGMVMFLIPFLRDIFDGLNAELPLSTRTLMATEYYLRNYWWMFILGLITSVALLKYLSTKTKFIFLWHGVVLKIPLLKSLVKSYNTARIIRTFSTLNKTGVALNESLEILASVPHNTHYKKALIQIKKEVNRGVIFSSAFEKHPHLFSPLVLETIRLGEKTGNLGDSLKYLAEIFEEELKNNLQGLTKVIQPCLIILVGVMVAGFAISVIVPLQQLPSMMKSA